MSDFEKLKGLSFEEIHKRTYISPKIVKYIINKEFSKIGNRAKVLGFISILERELGYDLSDLRQEVDQFFGEDEEVGAFRVEEEPAKTKSGYGLFVFAALLILSAGAALYFFKDFDIDKKSETLNTASSSSSFFESSSSEAKVVVNESNGTSSSSFAAVEKEAEENLTQTIEENSTTEENKTRIVEQESPFPTITIIPKKKLWIGILYLDDYSRKNYITSSPVELNTSKDQLIIMGHGLFQIEEDGKITDFTQSGKQRFIYRAGILEKIDKRTFKQYNRGKDW